MGVEFDNDFKGYPNQNFANQSGAFYTAPSFGDNQNLKGITGWLVKKGIAKNENSAKLIQLGVVVFNIVLTAFIIIRFL